jgi:hypothetical protein
VEPTVELIECRVCKDKKEPRLMKTLYGKSCRICRLCDGKGRGARYKKTPKSLERKSRIREKILVKRGDPGFADKWILTDSKQNDKRKGRQNDLTREFIRSELSKGCSYCGDAQCRMTLDRIDNSIGHLQSNVVPACLRCNYIRRDIPFEAWMIIVPAVREARIQGLFGTWDGSWIKPTRPKMEDKLAGVPGPVGNGCGP